jgi:hypothetical protein
MNNSQSNSKDTAIDGKFIKFFIFFKTINSTHKKQSGH